MPYTTEERAREEEERDIKEIHIGAREAKIRLIERLEERFIRGEISEETYLELKRKLEERLHAYEDF